ncbi:MAG: nucleoside recognition domain-containing protein [Candidatus Krumholzibacteriia bacterium]
MRRLYNIPLAGALTATRLEAVGALVRRVQNRLAGGPGGLAARLGAIAVHPVGGLLTALGVLFVVYAFVGLFGAGLLVGWLENGLFGRVLNPLLTAASDRFVPWAPLRDLLVGRYGLFTMALTYSLAIILPVVGTFFIAFGVLEDSGYMPRLAVMANRFFRRMGLHGKAVLPMILGLGCDTMATLTARIMDTRKERILVTLLLALGVPCSAQLGVILGMLGTVSFGGVLIWVGVVTLVMLTTGAVAARILPGAGSDFILELPPMRVPGIRNILIKTGARIEWYLKEAVPLFVLGTLLLFALDRLHLLVSIRNAAAPVVQVLLGLPERATDAFLIGFLRRDYGAAGLYDLQRQGLLDGRQVVVSLVVITLFVPCIANFFVMIKERGLRTALAIAGVIVVIALGVGGALNWGMRLLGVEP